jgi:hypothetical protein
MRGSANQRCVARMSSKAPIRKASKTTELSLDKDIHPEEQRRNTGTLVPIARPKSRAAIRAVRKTTELPLT